MSKFKPGQSVGVIDYEHPTRESSTITFPATSGATQGDYVNIPLPNGNNVAVWLDIDADGTAPSGATYVASDTKVEVDIATGDTATEVGTAAFSAIGSSLTGITLTDNEDGTLSLAYDDVGNITDPTPLAEDDGGAGSISVSSTDGSSESFPYESPGDSPTARKIEPDSVT